MGTARSSRFGVPAIVALLLVTLWSALIFWEYGERQRITAAREDQLAQRTFAVEEQTIRLFTLAEVSIKTAARWIEEHPGAFAAQDPEFIKLIDELRQLTDGVMDIRIVDADGNVYTVPASSRHAVANVADHEDIRIQLNPQTRQLYISDPVLSPVNNKWMVPVTYPVMKSNGELTIIGAVLELDRIARIFDVQREKPNGSITILKSNGVTLFRSPVIAGAISKSLANTPEFVEHLAALERGLYRVKGAFDGRERLVSHVLMTNYSPGATKLSGSLPCFSLVQC